MAELFSAFGIDWKLLIAQTVNFIIVFGGLTFFLYKPVLKIISERESKIAQGIKDAEKAEKARAKIEEEKAGIIASAHHDGEEIVSRAHEEAKRERGEVVTKAQERAEALLESARAEGEELKQSALRESEQEIARTAVLAAEKLIRTKLETNA